MFDIVKQMQYIELGGGTLRCHTMPMLERQNVAAHSFGVAWWCWMLTGGEATAGLIMAALAHDLAEHITGDIPSPSRAALGINPMVEAFELQSMAEAGIILPPLAPSEALVLRLADALDLFQLCIRERTLGNQAARIWRMGCHMERALSSMSLEVNNPLTARLLNDAYCSLADSWSALT